DVPAPHTGRRSAGHRQGQDCRRPRRPWSRRGHRWLGRGSGRTSVNQRRPRPSRRDLGGDQVEGRQAVRELLIAGRRKVYEVWVASDDDRGPLRDLTELANKTRVTVKRVSAGKLAGAARTDSPQGVLAHCAPLTEVELDALT